MRGCDMSAFICSSEHIEALALYWGLGNGRYSDDKSQQEIQATADIFFNENVRTYILLSRSGM